MSIVGKLRRKKKRFMRKTLGSGLYKSYRLHKPLSEESVSGAVMSNPYGRAVAGAVASYFTGGLASGWLGAAYGAGAAAAVDVAGQTAANGSLDNWGSVLTSAGAGAVAGAMSGPGNTGQPAQQAGQSVANQGGQLGKQQLVEAGVKGTVGDIGKSAVTTATKSAAQSQPMAIASSPEPIRGLSAPMVNRGAAGTIPDASSGMRVEQNLLNLGGSKDAATNMMTTKEKIELGFKGLEVLGGGLGASAHAKAVREAAEAELSRGRADSAARMLSQYIQFATSTSSQNAGLIRQAQGYGQSPYAGGGNGQGLRFGR